MKHILPKNKHHERGGSIAELLTSLGIFALFSSFIVLIISHLLSAPNRLQAKSDTLQSAVQTLYRLQRDARESNINGVYVCTASPTLCSAPASVASPTPVLVLASARTGNQLQWHPTKGTPAWTGVNVYWLSSAAGGNVLNTAFVAIAGLTTVPTASQAKAAADVAFASPNAIVVASNVRALLIAAKPASRSLNVKLVAQSTVGGKTNTTSFQSDIFVRN